VIEDLNRIDVWGHTGDGLIDVMVRNPTEKVAVIGFFPNGACEVVISNVQDHLDEWFRDSMNREAAGWFDDYHNLDDTFAWWNDLANQYSSFVKWNASIGVTGEGRNMPALEISYSKSNKPWIYYQCQIHAREWISGATCQYIVNQLLKEVTGGNPTIVNYLSNFNMAIVPVVNPDGYQWTWASDRLWRKNRRVNGAACQNDASSRCCGVDLNRNYDDHWGGGGSSADPCSDTFRGPSAASEPEVKATQNYIRALQTSAPVYGSIDWHSYSQLILRPYGWTRADSPSEAALSALGSAMAAAIKSVHGKNYVSEKSIDLYVTTGTANDYFYGDIVTSTNSGYYNYGYTIELRPTTAVPGFQLPPSEIIPTGEECYQATLAFFDYLLVNPPKIPQA